MSKFRTVIGFDFGYVRIGVAVGQELTATARPLATLTRQAQQPDWRAIDTFIVQWRPDLLVVGLPYYADGSPNAITRAALHFCRQLQGRYHLPVQTIDEHLSSQEAEYRIACGGTLSRRSRRNRGTVDQVAAAVILETWFNQLKQGRSLSGATGY